jgi:hypothetical protein
MASTVVVATVRATSGLFLAAPANAGPGPINQPSLPHVAIGNASGLAHADVQAGLFVSIAM